MTSRALLNNSNNKNKINSVGEDDDEFDKSLNRTKSVNNNNNKMKRADSSWKSIDDGEEEEGDDDDDEDDDLENELENDLENEDATTTKEKSPIKHTSCSSQQQHASTTSKQHLLKYLKNSISTISLSELASIPDIDIDIARMKVSQMIQTSSEAASQFVGRMSQTMQKNLDVGYELYKRNWSTENRKVMLFLISAVFAAITLIVFWVVVVYLAWKEIGRWLTSKVVIGIFGVVFLAVAPPLFPNIFAHMLAVLIIGMEAFSLTLNLIMLGCVHLIVFANRALAFSNLFRKFRVVSRKESDVSKLDIDRTNRAILI